MPRQQDEDEEEKQQEEEDDDLDQDLRDAIESGEIEREDLE